MTTKEELKRQAIELIDRAYEAVRDRRDAMTPQERLKEIERVLSELPCDSDDRADKDHAINQVLRLAREGGDGWQPIETAPRDGTVILLQGHLITGKVTAGFWDDSGTEWPWAFIEPNGGCMNGVPDDENGPTHWQPLPEPPQ